MVATAGLRMYNPALKKNDAPDQDPAYENVPDPDPLVRDTDPSIRTEMSRIRNTDFL
jgi:hypothetical protein